MIFELKNKFFGITASMMLAAFIALSCGGGDSNDSNGAGPTVIDCSGDNLASELKNIRNIPGDYVVNVSGDADIGSSSAITFEKDVTITICGDGKNSITGGGDPNKINENRMFIITDGAKLVLRDIILDGKDRHQTLIIYTGGTLVMEEGSVLTNISSDIHKDNHVVWVEGGTFIMNGGEIYGNKSSSNCIIVIKNVSKSPTKFQKNLGAIIYDDSDSDGSGKLNSFKPSCLIGAYPAAQLKWYRNATVGSSETLSFEFASDATPSKSDGWEEK